MKYMKYVTQAYSHNTNSKQIGNLNVLLITETLLNFSYNMSECLLFILLMGRRWKYFP